ncbi:MAG: hypothetical protein IJT68_09740 [Lentisphaeria bacterium]|nr:hypothetical protein [Lentisphaeria bacterium]
MATNNLILEQTAFLDGGKMDESGKHTLTKRFIYQIRDNTPEKRKRAIFDLEMLVPAKGSCMSDDARYTLKSANWNCYSWKNDSVKFFIDALYQRASDDEENGKPWNLSPFNFTFDTVEQAIAFRMAYDEDNQRTIPVVNSAGDPIDADTNEIFPQFGFSYYVHNFDASDVFDFSSSVNEKPQTIAGRSYPPGTLLIASISAENLITYEDDGYTPKWKYTQVNLSLRYNPGGWGRKLLDIGNRARFGNSTKSELIYQYYAPIYGESTVEFEEIPTLTNAQGYYSANRDYRAWLAEHDDATGCPAQLPYEFAENIPLTEEGKINTEALYGTIPYPEKEYPEYKAKNWHQLDIPTEIKRRWR